MFTLPLIVPREDLSIWPSSPLHRPIHAAELSSSNAPNRRNPTQGSHANAPRSFLAQLAADEAMIAQRKQNIRRFGAGWIRPPGIAKTYQAITDEIAEREEQELMARREAAMMELERAAEEEARREALEAGEGATGMEEGEGERDLDDDVPEAEDEVEDDESIDADPEEEEEEEEEEEGAERDLDDDVPEAASEAASEDSTDADVTFNEESFIEGSMVQADVEQMLDIEEGQAMMQGERDLDDDVPDGSYEHTDTEVEDSTSDFGGFSQADGSSRVSQDPASRQSVPGAGANSLLAGSSSYLGSSPGFGRGGRLDSPFGPSRSNGR